MHLLTTATFAWARDHERLFRRDHLHKLRLNHSNERKCTPGLFLTPSTMAAVDNEGRVCEGVADRTARAAALGRCPVLRSGHNYTAMKIGRIALEKSVVRV